MLSHHFNLLKKLVLDKSDLSNFTSADCKILSALVFQKTKKRISETTLKRVYGFAHSKFKPSQFTVDALAQYSGYANWMAFLNEYETQNGSGKTADWLNLSNDATKVTNFTLRALQNRSGIPFKKTIKRKFVDDHMDSFLSSDNIATALISPSGYGKTVALLHWIEERIAYNAVNNVSDIILFFSTPSLMSVLASGQDIHTWLLSLLGYNRTEILEMLLNGKDKKPGNFFLIIDGFDEHMFKNDQFQLVLTQLIDVLALYRSSGSFKLILTMRSDTWINNKHNLNIDEHTWFHGFITNYDHFCNVPLFNVNELHELCYSINPLANVVIGPEAIDLLSNPLYFQIYYKLNKNNFSLNNITGLYRYDIISAFILDKIYLDKYSSEKILLLFELVNMMNLQEGIYHINKIKADAALSKYNHAYHELLSLEFLSEFNRSADLQHNTYIEFGNHDFLEYIVAQKLLADNDNRFNLTLIQNADKQINPDLKLNVIKWFLIYAIKTDQQYNIDHLVKAELSLNKKAELIIFMGDIFEKEYNSAVYGSNTEHQFRFNINNELFNYFFGLEFISAEYEKTLQTLLRFDLTNDKKLLLKVSLAAISVIKMDMKGLEANLAEVRKIPHVDLFKYPINPLNCLDTIYHFLRYGIVKKDALAEITRFCFNPPSGGEALKQSIANDIMYILAAHTLQIAKRPRKLLRYVQLLTNVYKDLSTYSTEYTFFLKALIADTYFVLDDKKNLIATYKSILKLGNFYNDSYTPYITVHYHAIKIKTAIISQQLDMINAEYKCFAYIADKYGFKLSKFYIISLLLKKNLLAAETDMSQFYRQLNYEHSKLMIESSVTEMFEAPK